ncbi:hypothetical protein [Limobrevibacterium gyesilva]|uniref:Uncharacterized protein n=1 Tax=Limobrevibacterium gyesilva TaxID=2991712 RepID=A0AA41YP24_9PROT|nr:hypothetical protein [Limobrevibacterium gyesilva]MCW3476280.1 hypothetical protein [Limobrevibacterium gyesilva]
MAQLLLVQAVLAGCVLAVALGMDGVIAVPLEKIARFPFRNLPATNGVLLGSTLAACLWLIAWASAPGGLR